MTILIFNCSLEDLNHSISNLTYFISPVLQTGARNKLLNVGTRGVFYVSFKRRFLFSPLLLEAKKNLRPLHIVPKARGWESNPQSTTPL